MSVKRIVVICCCLPLLLIACASRNTLLGSAAGDSMLVIGAQLKAMNGMGEVNNKSYVISAVSVKNLDTGTVYDMVLNSGHAIAELPAGTYCFNSISPENSSALEYCSQPFFTLAPYKIMVAGYFIFALDYADHSYTLSDSFVDKQGLFNQLSKSELSRLEDFEGVKS